MGLEEVKEEVIRNAKEQENSFVAEARKEASRIARDAEKKIEEMKEKSDAELKKIFASIKRQELASAELESKKMVLEAKKQVIEKVFSEARKMLETLDEKKREAYMKSLLEKIKKELDASYFYCSKKDIKFLRGLDADAVDITGGLMAENKAKTVRVDYSFETLLQGIKESELQSISKILFG